MCASRYQRNHQAFQRQPGRRCRCTARSPARFNDDGVTALYRGALEALHKKTKVAWLTKTRRGACREVHRRPQLARRRGDTCRRAARGTSRRSAETVRKLQGLGAQWQAALIREIQYLEASLHDAAGRQPRQRLARPRRTLKTKLDELRHSKLAPAMPASYCNSGFEKLREGLRRSDDYVVITMRGKEFRTCRSSPREPVRHEGAERSRCRSSYKCHGRVA